MNQFTTAELLAAHGAVAKVLSENNKSLAVPELLHALEQMDKIALHLNALDETLQTKDIMLAALEKLTAEILSRPVGGGQ